VLKEGARAPKKAIRFATDRKSGNLRLHRVTGRSTSFTLMCGSYGLRGGFFAWAPSRERSERERQNESLAGKNPNGPHRKPRHLWQPPGAPGATQPGSSGWKASRGASHARARHQARCHDPLHEPCLQRYFGAIPNQARFRAQAARQVWSAMSLPKVGAIYSTSRW